MNVFVRRCAFLICGCAWVLSVAGCGGAAADADPGLVPARGTITHNGKPLSGGSVSFVSAQDRSKIYGGKIAANGTYEMRVSPSAPGVLPGEYLVGVQSWETAPTMDDAGKEVPGKSAIPDTFMSPEKSGLKVTVEPGGGTYDLELK